MLAGCLQHHWPSVHFVTTFHFLFHCFAPSLRLPPLFLSFPRVHKQAVLISTGHFKAVYQRARAHAALCHEDEARRDFELVAKLDPKFKPFIQQELKTLGERMRAVHARQHKTYWDTTQEKWRGSEAKGAERKKIGPEKEREAAQKTSDSEANKKVEKSDSQQWKEEEKCDSQQWKEENRESEKEEEKSESEQ